MDTNMNLTDKQRKAVYTRGKNILVSAAAGSGKTRVLTLRIVSLIEEGADIRRMLVCTFTTAAAAEMRERIADTIEEYSASSLKMRAQGEYVDQADICTIHKFAIKLIRENFLKLSLSAGIRIGNEDEINVLRNKAARSIFARFSDDPDFIRLYERYAGKGGMGLLKVLLQLYNFSVSKPERMGWMTRVSRTDYSGEYYKLYRELTLTKLTRLREILASSLAASREQML